MPYTKGIIRTWNLFQGFGNLGRKCMGEAIKKESQAIALVEQEIESWNKK